MSKNYDLYPDYERKLDNLRRRIFGYEKMKRDLQRQIQILKNKNKKQKEVIDKAIETLEWGIKSYHNSGSRTALFEVISDSKSILKEVLE